MDVGAWLAGHARVCDAILWQDSGGVRPFTSWPGSRQQDLSAAVNLYLDGGAPAVNPVPPNVVVLADGAAPDTAFSAPDGWQVYRAWTAHSLAMDICGRFTWRLDDYADEDLLRLLSSAPMFHLVNGKYHLDSSRFRVTPGPPDVALAFLAGNGLIVDRRDDSTGLILEWCRDYLTHFAGAATAADMEAVWQYRGWPPMTAILDGTVDSRQPALGVQHWTAGCWGTTGFLRAVLRAANVPCWSALTRDGQVLGHSLPYFTAENAYLSHGDDPYDAVTRAVPEITGRDLMIGQGDFDARFGPNPDSANVGYRPWQLGLGEVWRGQWTAGWTSFVPLQMAARHLEPERGISVPAWLFGGQRVEIAGDIPLRRVPVPALKDLAVGQHGGRLGRAYGLELVQFDQRIERFGRRVELALADDVGGLGEVGRDLDRVVSRRSRQLERRHPGHWQVAVQPGVGLQSSRPARYASVALRIAVGASAGPAAPPATLAQTVPSIRRSMARQ